MTRDGDSVPAAKGDSPLRRARSRRGWTRSAAIHRFGLAVKAQGEQPPSEASLKRMFAYWESGERAVTVAAYQRAFAEIYETSLSELGFDPPQGVTDDPSNPAINRPDDALPSRSAGHGIAVDGEPHEPAAASRNRRGRLLDVGRWSLWTLPRGLQLYVVAVLTLWVCMTTVAFAHLTLRSEELIQLGVLLGCAAVSMESGRRLGEASDRVWRDMLGFWTVPMMLLLPPAYALTAPLPLHLLSQWRVHRKLPYRVAFNISVIGLASGVGSLVFHRLTGPGAPVDPSAVEVGRWLLLGMFAAALRHLINLVLVAIAVKASHPEMEWSQLLFSREGWILDTVQISVGLAVAALSLNSIWLIPLMLPTAVLLSGRAMMRQLTALSHTDAETEVFTAGGWERESEVTLARAQRKQTPVAVLVIDLGQPDRGPSATGAPISDAELRSFVDALRSELKPDSIVGRLGDAQFVVLVSSLRPADMQPVAERVRALAESAASSEVGHRGWRVSIGVASLSKPRIEVEDLVDAANVALHRSKASGGNRIVHLGFGVDEDLHTET